MKPLAGTLAGTLAICCFAASIVVALAGCSSSSHGPASNVPTGTVPADDAPAVILFNPADEGRAPRGFTTALTGGGGRTAWVVRRDPSSPAPDHLVLVQESVDNTRYRFPLCIYDRIDATDVSATVQLKPISGAVDQAGGIVLRYTSENYYVARSNALEDNINLYKTVNGNRIKIAEAPTRVAPNQWHTLGFSARGKHLTVTFDGKTMIETDDDTFLGAGKVGLWTKADSVTAFADLRIDVSR